jgi:hypothetical protein
VNNAAALSNPLYIKALDAEIFSDKSTGGSYHCYMSLFDGSKIFKHNISFNDFDNILYTVTELGTGYYKVEWKPNPAGTNTFFSYAGYSSAYIAFTFIGSGNGLIITKNEPIE